MDDAAKNTDRELWRERPDDFYAASLFVTEGGGIGMNVGGSVVVKPIREWIKLAWPTVGPHPEPNRCPTCRAAWSLNPPVKIDRADEFRCIECKAVYTGAMLRAHS